MIRCRPYIDSVETITTRRRGQPAIRLGGFDRGVVPKRCTMMTIREAIEVKKCRKGAAVGTTKDGAYWLAIEPVKIRSWGGDGIGNSAADLNAHLEFRHYRSGECRAVVHISSCHQNHSSRHWWHRVEILDCTNVEDVIVALKRGVSGDYDRETVYSDLYEESLTKAMTDLGLAIATPSPDEVI